MKKISSGYIVSVVSAVLLLLEVVGVKVDVPYVNEVLMAVLGVLVALGIVSGTHSTKKKSNDKKDALENSDDNIVTSIDKIADKIDDVVDAVLSEALVDEDDADDESKDINVLTNEDMSKELDLTIQDEAQSNADDEKIHISI